MSSASRILVVDDNTDISDWLRSVLERSGYEVLTACHGRDALDLHRERPAHALLTDIYMPVVDGLETIASFRSRYPAMKIIAMSGGGVFSHNDYLQVAGHIGADATLQKPFSLGALLDLLAGWGLR